MPKRSSGVVIHDDSFHTGSAKRNAANGVAPLSASGTIFTFGSRLSLKRDGSNFIFIVEDTSGETAIRITRVGANDFDAHIIESNVAKQIQTESMKDVASGIAGLDASAKVPNTSLYRDVASGIVAQDASGNATVTGSSIYLTKDGSNTIYIRDRGSSEAPLYFVRTAVQSYAPYIEVGGNPHIVAVLDAAGDIPHMRPKAASANLRHSRDNQLQTTSLTYVVMDTFTFGNGISGTIRTVFDLWSDLGVETVYGRIFKNGVAIGTEQSTSNIAPQTFTEDINYGVLAPGDTITLNVKSPTGAAANIRNFRLYYDNAADTVLVAGVTAT